MVEFLECCNRKHKSVTTELAGNEWFFERYVDYATCDNCRVNILRKRFVNSRNESVETTVKGFAKIERKYNALLKEKLQTFDNSFTLPKSGVFFPNIHYMDIGIEFKMDGTRTGQKWNGEKWLQKVGAKYV